MSELLSAGELAQALPSLPEWSGDTSAIRRTAEMPDFPTAISVVDRVASEAEQMSHHPDMYIRWKNVTFTCTTHSAGGVTQQDLDLAHRIDDIVSSASPA